MSDKIYIGSGKIVNTKFGDLTKISFSESDIDKLKANLTNGWINLVVKEKQNKVEGKPTHYLEVDTWKPNATAKDDITRPLYAPPVNNAKGDLDSLPF